MPRLVRIVGIVYNMQITFTLQCAHKHYQSCYNTLDILYSALHLYGLVTIFYAVVSHMHSRFYELTVCSLEQAEVGAHSHLRLHNR